MKKEISAEFMWHLDEVVIPFPVAIVTTVDAKDRINAAPFGLILPYCSDPGKPQILWPRWKRDEAGEPLCGRL